MLSTSSFVLRFSRFLLPTSAIRQSLCVQPDLTPVTQYAQCAGALFLEPTYDPIRREITYRQSKDQPKLLANTKYKLTVLAPTEGSSSGGIRAFDGAALASARSFEFTTAAMDPAGAVLESLPTDDTFCRTKKTCVAECAASTKAVVACETAGSCSSCSAVCLCDPSSPSCTNNCPKGDAACDTACKACNTCQSTCRATCTAACPESVQGALANCAFGGCHHENRDETGAVVLGAAMGLDLFSREFIAATAINKVAHQTQQGEHGDDIDRSPIRFGRAMPLIDPGTPDVSGGAPGNSYLLYKLAIGPSATGEAAASPEEIERLRASVVVGLPMPPVQGSPITEADLSNLVTWIAQGAPTPACP